MRQKISNNPLWNIILQIPMKVAIVVNNIHFFMNRLNLLKNLLRCRLTHIIYHLLIQSLQISTQNDVEIYRTGKFIHVVSTECVYHVWKWTRQCYYIQHLVYPPLSLLFTSQHQLLVVEKHPFLQIEAVGLHEPECQQFLKISIWFVSNHSYQIDQLRTWLCPFNGDPVSK